MRSVKTIRRDLARAAVRAAVALFIIPVLVLLFTGYVQYRQDAAFQAAVAEQAASHVESRQKALDAFHSTPPSSVCWSSGDETVDAFREQFCARWSPQWQLAWASRISKIMVAAGLLLLAASAGLGLAAFHSRAAQYKSIVIGWRLLVWASVVEIVIQSAMLAWLTLAVPVYFWQKYSPQLGVAIIIIAIMAAGSAIAQIFRRQPEAPIMDGELVTAQDAPALWARIGQLANKLGTAPPRHVIAGIDNNFFVTEGEVRIADRTLHGRSLFVSLPLLRVLDTEEADAVLAHELAHMSGGDTESLAAIGPRLSRFDNFLASMNTGGAQVLAFHLLHLYRIILELALRKDSREREFVADLVAARHTSPASIMRSLIKVTGYSAYRERVEQELFARTRKLDNELGIAATVAAGLRPFACSPDFIAGMTRAGIPHPFDTHPSLAERMGSVGTRIEESGYAAVMLARGDNVWIDAIPGAVHIERRLWAGYEERFALAHEQNLAYRYLPSSDEERALVEKFFPPRAFSLSRGRSVVVTFDALTLAAHKTVLHWDTVKSIAYTEGTFADVLTVKLDGAKSVKTRLWGIQKQRSEFRACVGHYWQRHRVARGLA